MFCYLKAGGAILIITQNSRSLNYVIQGEKNFLKGNWPSYGWDETHVRFYSPSSLQSKLEKAGFSDCHWFESYYFPYRILRDKLGSWGGEGKIFSFPELLGINRKWPINRLGWSIGCYAVKPTDQ